LTNASQMIYIKSHFDAKASGTLNVRHWSFIINRRL